MPEKFIPIDPTYAVQELSSEIIKTAEDMVKNDAHAEGSMHIVKLIDHYLTIDVITAEEAAYLADLADVAIDYFIRRNNGVRDYEKPYHE